MENKTNLKVVHRRQRPIASSPEEIYQQLFEVKEDLESIIYLLDQHLNGVPAFLSVSKNRRGDTEKPSIASFG